MEDLKVLEEREVLGKEFKMYGTIENPLFLAKYNYINESLFLTKYGLIVTKSGRIFRINKHNKYYKNGIDNEIVELPYFIWGGYKIVNYKNKTYKVHRLIAKTFIPNPLNLPQVNHKDGNKLNNNYLNLEWCTQQQNTQHAYDNGLAKSNGNSMKGENNPMYGKHHTEETKKKMSENRKGKKAWNKSTPFDYENKPCTIGQFKRVLEDTNYTLDDFEKFLFEKGKNNKYYFKFKKNSKECS